MKEEKKLPLRLTGSLAAFLLISLLLLFSLLSVAAGVHAYVSVNGITEKTANERDGLQYILNKLRAMDGDAVISVEENESGSVLHFVQVWDGETYETRILCKDGALVEQFFAADADESAVMEETIAEAERLTVQAGTPYRIVLRLTDGQEQRISVYLRSRGEGAS